MTCTTFTRAYNTVRDKQGVSWIKFRASSERNYRLGDNHIHVMHYGFGTGQGLQLNEAANYHKQGKQLWCPAYPNCSVRFRKMSQYAISRYVNKELFAVFCIASQSFIVPLQ